MHKMNSNVLFVALVVVVGVGAVALPRQSSPGKVFLFGGATEDTSANIYNALRDATGKPSPNIVVAITAASSLAIGLEAYYIDDPGSWSYERLFTFYGFQPSVLQLARDNWEEGASNSTALGQANIQLVEAADVIFFNGGDQSRHSRSWFNTDGSDSDIMGVVRRRFLEDGAIVAGTSAGAAIMSKRTYGEGYSYGYFYFNADLKECDIGQTLQDDRDGTNTFRYTDNGGHMQGFGFVQGALVDTHVDARGRFGRLPAAMHSTLTPYGIGVGEDTALYINGEEAVVLGNDGVWWVDSTEAQYGVGPYFTVTGLLISYLTEGDRLNLATKEVISTKSLITTNAGTAYDSRDVFSGREGIRSITTLVTSNSTRSTGQSKERNPTANVVFHRGQGELAYTMDGKFTVDKLHMDLYSI